MLLIKLAVLVALIRLLISVERPIVCAGVYGGVCLVLGLFGEAPLWYKVAGPLIAFGLCALYFWLLDRFDTLSLWWFVTLIFGLGIVLRA